MCVCFLTEEEQAGSQKRKITYQLGDKLVLLLNMFFSESAKSRVLTPMKLHLHL